MVKSIIRDGTSQEERMLPALKEGYFNVDETRFEDLLSMAAEYAGLLKYFDEGNRQDGDWKALFESDEVCILASILATNLKQAETDLFRFVREWESKSGMLRDGRMAMDALPTFVLAQKINSWFVNLGALSSVAAVRAHEKIADLIEKTLGHKLLSLRAFLQGIHEGAVEATFREFDPVWYRAVAGSEERHHQSSVEERQLPAGQFLKANFYSFHNAVLSLQESMAEILQLSLGRSNHDPAMGLFIAFLKLFVKVQQRINRFTQEHLNFYYGEVLKVRRREFIPDSAHLLFTPDVSGREVLIGKGTEFRAGVDENSADLIYTADDDLFVTDAKVCALYSVFLERDELNSPENELGPPWNGWNRTAGSRQFATAVKVNRLSTTAKDSQAGCAGLAPPLFGDPQRYGRKFQFEEARLGFAAASSALLLKRGQRDITVTFKLALTTPEISLDSFVRRLSEILKTTEADAFFKAFRYMFRISLTAEAGWLEAEEYLPLCRIVDENCEEDCFKIQLRLPDSAGAIVPYSQAVHGEYYDTDLPIIRFIVNPLNYLYPFDLLSEVIVREIVIEVEVTDCTDLFASNQFGPLNVETQFTPFGPNPSQGDYLVVGCYEAARKRLTRFDVEIEWAGLPPSMEGFANYYRAYPMLFDNRVFKARLAVLRDRKWIPAGESAQPETGMFESESGADTDKNEKVERRRKFSFQGLCQFLQPLEDVAEERYGYGLTAKDGFFKIVLGAPPYAFGHRDYPLILSRMLTENARLKRFGPARVLLKSRPLKPVPNPPYTPLVSSISVNYKAVSIISLEQVASSEEGRIREKMFHLHPFGLEMLSPKAYGKIALIPRCDADGNLLIGLSASKLSGMLRLFFHLRDDSLPEAGDQPIRFTWHYLASNRWKKLDAFRVISDTTTGFLSSGTVALDIPPDINRENSILPSDLFWLRVSSDSRQLYALCSLYAVHAHAVKVTWKRQERNTFSHLAARLPTGTIKEARFSIPGIAEIRQITDSSGGAPAESNEQWIVRVSERLKHKNRGVVPWDYERLILQRFPEIYKVKCFPCMSDDAKRGAELKPGHLLIVLIPYLKEAAALNLQPMVNALLLHDIKEFVMGLSSGFARINVRNPAYELIQVRCKVKFKKGAEHGLCINRLNQEIFDYLSPWSPGGYEASFGWHIRCNEIQAHIQRLEYVEAVSGVSLLQVSEVGHQGHLLADTARQQSSEVSPTYPWSIAVPFTRQLIEVMDERSAWPPVKTGIADLAIGSSFILSRDNS